MCCIDPFLLGEILSHQFQFCCELDQNTSFWVGNRGEWRVLACREPTSISAPPAHRLHDHKSAPKPPTTTALERTGIRQCEIEASAHRRERAVNCKRVAWASKKSGGLWCVASAMILPSPPSARDPIFPSRTPSANLSTSAKSALSSRTPSANL